MKTPIELNIDAMTNLPVALRYLIDDWDTLDYDLVEHYTHEIDWFMSNLVSHLKDMSPDQLLIVKESYKKLLLFKDDIKNVTGCDLEMFSELDPAD